MTKQMQAIVLDKTGNADVLQVQSVARPKPASNQVLIRNQATALNFIDVLIRQGGMPPEAMPDLPHILGVEGSGIIEAVGSDVNHLEAEQRCLWFGVIGSGGYGEYSVVDATYVVPIADNISFNQAAAVPVIYSTAWHMLTRLSHLNEGDWVLVYAAAGGVGTAILQLAQRLKLHTIGVVSTAKVDFAQTHGATEVIDYRTENVIERTLDLTDGQGVAVSLNSIGGDSIRQDMQLLRPFGQVISYGFLAGLPNGTLAETLVANFGKSVAIRVSDIYTFYSTDPKGMNSMLMEMTDLLATGQINPVIDSVIPFTQASQAHALLQEGSVRGKLVLSF